MLHVHDARCTRHTSHDTRGGHSPRQSRSPGSNANVLGGFLGVIGRETRRGRHRAGVCMRTANKMTVEESEVPKDRKTEQTTWRIGKPKSSRAVRTPAHATRKTSHQRTTNPSGVSRRGRNSHGDGGAASASSITGNTCASQNKLVPAHRSVRRALPWEPRPMRSSG